MKNPTKEQIKQDALKYKHRSDWHKKSNRRYVLAKQIGQSFFLECVKHMTFKPRPGTIKYPINNKAKLKKLIFDTALKYPSVTLFRLNHMQLYRHAKSNGWLEKLKYSK